MEAKGTTEICRLFQSTLTSLAEDTRALNELSRLERALEKGDEETITDETIPDDFRALEEAVSRIEREVQVLRQISENERFALEELERIHRAAMAQSLLMDRLLRKFHEDEELEDAEEDDNSSTEAHVQNDKENYQVSNRQDMEALKEAPQVRTSNHAIVEADRLSLRKTSQRDTTDEQVPTKKSHIRWIQRDEFQSIPRTIRGRITLAVVNEALHEICELSQTKHNNKKGIANRWSPDSGADFYYCNFQSEDKNPASVTEQEIRQQCAFFRSGESTARAILAILRTMKRLKQVPGHAGTMTYIVL